MAIPAVVVALASALGGALVYREYLRTSEGQAANRAYLQAVHTLDQGKRYAVQLVIDPSRGLTSRVPQEIAQTISQAFTQMGFALDAAAQPATTQDEARSVTGQPSEWRFVGRWTRTEKHSTTAPPWVAHALVYELPSA